MNISPARISAFEILLKIEKDKAFSSILLPAYEKNLEEKDRALCHELVLGSIRKQIYLDKMISGFSEKKLDIEVRIALRLGIYQLLFLEKIPAYPAINDSVNLVWRAKKNSAKGFVNAILRKVSRKEFSISYSDELDRISCETSHPPFLIEKWAQQFGMEEAEAIANANNRQPPLDFRFTAKTTEAVKSALENEEKRNDKKFLQELAANGKIYFQDRASQMVAEAADLQPGEKFLDLCMAPGSKFSLLASKIGKESHKDLFGGDLYAHRIKTSIEICKKQGISRLNFIQYNAEESLPFPDGYFDRVLIDAPCSGSGTIRHNPEIRYSLSEKGFTDLIRRQAAILQNASKLIKPGGRLIYSTCSIEKEENESIIEGFLNSHDEFMIERAGLDEKYLTKVGYARTFPHRDGLDGFFIAVLVRKS